MAQGHLGADSGHEVIGAKQIAAWRGGVVGRTDTVYAESNLCQKQ